jgi:hypothetical protein
VRLLFHFSWRQRLVSLGALATILMLVFPTFVQQSIQPGDRIIVEYNSRYATMARTVDVFENVEDKPKVVKLAGKNGTVCKYYDGPGY